MLLQANDMHKCKASKGMPCYSIISPLMSNSSLEVEVSFDKVINFEKAFYLKLYSQVLVNLHNHNWPEFHLSAYVLIHITHESFLYVDVVFDSQILTTEQLMQSRVYSGHASYTLHHQYFTATVSYWLLHAHMHISVADLDGVPWVPWNPPFEELHAFAYT